MISENHGFQVIRALQLDRTGHSFGNEFRYRDNSEQCPKGGHVSIDLAMNARSMGAQTWKARTPDELRGALNEARKESRTCVIVVETSRDVSTPPSNVWFDCAPAEISQESETQRVRHSFEENQSRQRLYY